MDEHALMVDTLVEQVCMAIDEPYESLRMTIEEHAYEKMGDPGVVGTGAWHLMHIAEVFRIHASVFMGPEEMGAWPMMTGDVADAGRMVREDANRFAAWCKANPERVGRVVYGTEQGFEEMMGVMLRHIVWHSAAVHYWFIWYRETDETQE